MFRSLKFDSETRKLFFTSDNHFHHANIIKYCDRPFHNVEEMNSTMIKNWNDKVGVEDLIFILGDFCFGKTETWRWLIETLNGEKILVLGNHDKNVIKNFSHIGTLVNILVHDPEIKDGQRITLCHYPMLSWYQSHRGAWQLFGHVHGRSMPIQPTQLDVGADVHNFTPVSYEEVKTIITKQHMK